MASISRSHVFSPLAAAALLALGGAAHGQDASTPIAPAQSVQVVGHASSDASGVTGFAQPLARTPIQAEAIDTRSLIDIGATSLSDLTRLDASLTDSYNAIGYWTTFTLRGFQVDNRTNFRRDGLPINAETALALENKSEVDVLKGLSGMQAGISAPGGLVDLVVKRPDADLRSVSLQWAQPGTLGVAADLSQRFGDARQFGARLNLSATRLDPNVRDDVGHRNTASLATDWRIDNDRLLEVEFEHSLQSQPSVPAFSMLGGVVPDPHSIDPRINLNDQPWSQPVVLQGNTMSVRYTQALNAQWRLKIHALQQQLVSNDHLAFAYGYAGCTVCNQFAADGTYSLYDFRSDGERRQTRDLDLSIAGDFSTGTLKHALTAGVLLTRFTARFNDEAYNYVGEGSIDGQTFVPADPSLTTPNVDRTERSTEFYLRDAVQLARDWTAWGGLRHTRLQHASYETSTGTPADDTDYTQVFTTPWLALSRALTEDDMVYVSWGEGIQSDVAPTYGYVNNGRPLSSTVSRQWEAGYKHGDGTTRWGITAYRIEQAYAGDIPGATTAAGALYGHDGITRSQGLEAEAQTRAGALTLRASAMVQRVRRERSADPTQNGLRPTNVPDQSVKILAGWDVSQLPGLTIEPSLAYEGGRAVLPDNSATIPGWTRYDLNARYAQRLAGMPVTWRAGVDNLFDRRAWREAPYQYDHAYLFPLEARTFHASVEAKF
jgi:iron complex outermembrane receptor protein